MSKVVKSRLMEELEVSRRPFLGKHFRRVLFAGLIWCVGVSVLMQTEASRYGGSLYEYKNTILLVLILATGIPGAWNFLLLIYNLSPNHARKIAETKAVNIIEKMMKEKFGNIFIHVDYSYAYNSSYNSISGSALAVTNKELYIVEYGALAIVPFSAIRSYKWNLYRPIHYTKVGSGGVFSGQDVTDSYRVAAMNSSELRRAHFESGFIIKVADIEAPEWRFSCQNERIMKKWYEILNQINEGTFSGSPPEDPLDVIYKYNMPDYSDLPEQVSRK